MPPLSPGGRKAGAAANTNGTVGLSGNSLRSEALNRAHRRVRSGGSLNIPSSPGGRGLLVPRAGANADGSGGGGGTSSGTSGSYRRQHLQMRLSSGFDSGAAPSTSIGAFPSSPSHRGLPPSSPRRLRSVSYDETDATVDKPQDDSLDAIRAELEKRKEKKALHDQRRRELEEMMSSASTTPKRAPPTRNVQVTESGDDGISPLKMGDSAGKNRRPKKVEADDADNTYGGGKGDEETGGGDDKPTVVSPTSPDRDEEVETGHCDKAGRSGRATGGSGSSSGRRGRSLTPRDRSVNGTSALQGPPPRRLLSHSPAPQNMGVRRLGRAVDAVLARRKRRGSISAHTAGPSTGDASGSSNADPSEQYQQSLTDEEKHVLAKIIVAIDTKLERELDMVKSDLQDKKKAETTAKGALKAEQEKIARLERELEQAKSGAAVSKALQESEVTDDRINELELEHETSLRAIQRVLADVTNEKDAKLEEMEKNMKNLAAENEALKQKLVSTPSSSQGGGEVDAVCPETSRPREGGEKVGPGVGASAEEIKKHNEVIGMLESKVASLVEEKQAMDAELATAQTIASASMASKESELSKRDDTIKSLEEQLASMGKLQAKESPIATNADDVEKFRLENQSLKKDLQNKTSSLETAKMMITSLESASGSQANDLRAKLKERNEELATLKVRADSSNSELATIKSELIHMQTKFVEADNAAREARIVIKKQRAVHRQLKAEISKISGQSNSTIRYNEQGEVEVELSLGGEVTEVVQKSLTILEEGDNSTSADNGDRDELNTSGEMDTLKKKVEGLSEEKDAAIVRLNKDLVEKNAALHNFDDQLNLQKEESKRLRQELEKARDEFRQILSESQFEIQRLTDDFTIANEQLAKKEKELSVLKESLNEPSTGYISDDDDFDEDDDEGAAGIVPTDAAALQASISAEAENLQLLLKQAQEGLSSTSTTNERLKALENEVHLQQDMAAKQLKEKDDALANAKMIISSLEQSNKSMLEDLRNRLHDSNTAIVSLLTKNQSYEQEVKELRTRKEEEGSRLRNEAKESADQLTDLRKRVEDYERIAIRMGVDDGSSLSSLGETKSSYFESDDNDITSDDVGITTDEGPSPLKLYPATTTDRKPEEGEEEV